MRTRILLAVVVALALVVATAALWTTDVRRASSAHPGPERLDAGASIATPLDPVQRAVDGRVPDRVVASSSRSTAIVPLPRASMRIDPADFTHASADHPDAFDRPQHRFVGSVRSRRDGTPIATAQITCSDRLATAVSTDATGSYAMSTRTAPSFSLTCRAPGWQCSSRVVSADGPADSLVDFVLDPAAEMIVRLQDRAGRPLFESLSEADLEAARALRPVFTDAFVARGSRLSGNVVGMRAASLGVHSDAWYRVNFDTDARGSCCLVLGDRVVDVVPFTSRTSEIVLVTSREDIQSSTGSLRFTIVDTDTGAPIPGVVVHVTPSAGVPRTVKPDLRGGVLVDGLPEGDTKIEIDIETGRDFFRPHASRSGWTTERPVSTDTIAVRAGELTDLGRKAIEHIVSISGWVDAAPDGDASPSVFATHEDESGTVSVEATEPDATGNFKFSGLKSGYYRVGCHMLPNAQTVLVDARFTDVQGVHIAASADDLKSIRR